MSCIPASGGPVTVRVVSLLSIAAKSFSLFVVCLSELEVRSSSQPQIHHVAQTVFNLRMPLLLTTTPGLFQSKSTLCWTILNSWAEIFFLNLFLAHRYIITKHNILAPSSYRVQRTSTNIRYRKGEIQVYCVKQTCVYALWSYFILIILYARIKALKCNLPPQKKKKRKRKT